MSARVSYLQMLMLIEYMERNGDIARPQEELQGYLQVYKKWTELAGFLNSQGSGCTKTVEKWKKFWADLKSKTKKKAAILRIHSGGTGGGPASSVKLSTIEKRIMAILGAVTYIGIAYESGFSDLSDTDMQSGSQAVTSDTSQHLHSIDTAHTLTLPSTSHGTPQTHPIVPSRQPIHPCSPTPSMLQITQETQPVLPSRQAVCFSSPTPTLQIIQQTRLIHPILPSRHSVCFPSPMTSTTQTPTATGTVEESEALRSPVPHVEHASRQRESRLRADLRRRRRLPTPFQIATDSFVEVERVRNENERMRIDQMDTLITVIERLGERFLEITNHLVNRNSQ